MTPNGERWVLIFDALPDSVPAANRVRTLVKTAKRLKLKGRAYEESAEVRRLQRIIEGLAARVAASGAKEGESSP